MLPRNQIGAKLPATTLPNYFIIAAYMTLTVSDGCTVAVMIDQGVSLQAEIR
jgi:hypothetical protein